MTDLLRDKIDLLKQGKITPEEFIRYLQYFPYENLGDIKLDFHRRLRRGIPEVIYGEGKSSQQLSAIIHKFKDVKEDFLATRINREKFSELSSLFPDLVYHEKAKIVTFDQPPKLRFKGQVLVLSAGSSDESVAEEAYVSSVYLGNKTDKIYDVGVACLSRILDVRQSLDKYSVLMVVAGMEGALPSIVAGLTATPIIAVPTSVGYGANFNGLAALLSMLNSCAGGVSVVNIDNGFGAAYQATLINQKIGRLKE